MGPATPLLDLGAGAGLAVRGRAWKRFRGGDEMTKCFFNEDCSPWPSKLMHLAWRVSAEFTSNDVP